MNLENILQKQHIRYKKWISGHMFIKKLLFLHVRPDFYGVPLTKLA